MKVLFLGFYVADCALAFGYTLMPSEFACQALVQRIEDGERLVLKRETGEESPPLVIGLCVDPEKRVAWR